jgi:hypothetical protein
MGTITERHLIRDLKQCISDNDIETIQTLMREYENSNIHVGTVFISIFPDACRKGNAEIISLLFSVYNRHASDIDKIAIKPLFQYCMHISSPQISLFISKLIHS